MKMQITLANVIRTERASRRDASTVRRPGMIGRKGARKNCGQQGFTLIELLIVLVILGLLAGLAAPRAIRYLGGAKSDAAKLQIESLGAALDLYRLDVGFYPSTSEGLGAMTEAPASAKSWNGPYTKNRTIPLDPWGNEYHYNFPGENSDYDLYSLGADNAEGGENENVDVRNN